ncbi:hypothetical protein ERJ75_000808200 [Trypanosoma vivax]|uniref:Uncharacterized protein n=1 Tax=Trypanosoma vivax (strain Y486) TaxID=1055687 RepID=F9WVW8_TRYVY|nr:hypothetical protein ERJ75_000808200 [Trypanosoma vivax]CCD21731.1 hypothetical protein, conserved in T.vivax [Trypanosoma vivax Y486]|eukprot:CCD21731.1 hypothetical protein, conserved in T.vivax [Trypanosoma vivax Y486]
MKACTAKGWAVWLFLVVLAVGRAEAEDDKNIVADNLEPVCDLSAALKFVAAKAKEARSCIPNDAAGGEGTDTVLFAKAFGAAWRWGADNTNDTVRGILLETRVFAQRAERAQRIAAMSEHLAAMATEKADRIDEFVRMLANYKASSGNGYCLGDGSGPAVGTNSADPDDTETAVGTGSDGNAEKLKGCSGTGTAQMDYAKGKWESKGHATALEEALAAFDSHWTTGNGTNVSAGSGGAACPLAKEGASGAAGYTADKITFAGMFTAKTSTGLALLFKGSRDTGLADVQALITNLTQLTTLADTELQQRKFLCVPGTDDTKHTTDATALAKAAAAIYDELQAREAAPNARRNTPKEQGKGKQHATASPSSTERKEEEGSSQAGTETMEKQTDAAHRSEDTSEARAWHALLAACSAAATATRT